MLPSLFSLVALLSYFTLISSFALEGRNSWRLSHGLPPARPRRLHSSATETAHRRSTSSIPLMVDGGDFASSSSTSPWTVSGIASIQSGTGHTGSGYGRLSGTSAIASLTSSITGLTPSSVYTLSYWTMYNSGSSPSCTVSALVDGLPVPGASQLFDLRMLPNTWIQVTGKFTATAATESIALQNQCSKGFNVGFVDDVTVSLA